MIILFDETETKFDSLGLGVLKDSTQCTVTEELNGGFDLEMRYRVSGQLYDKIGLNKIIYAKANPFDEPQPFRITSISKPINGTVTINAEHVSYDANGIPVKAIDGKTLADTFNQINANSLIQNKFNFRTDITSGRSFKTTKPYNLRAILMGDEEESLLGVYDAEVKFDKFDIHILSKRGKNRGAKVTYGNNMSDLTHEVTNDRLYNGIMPYYHKETVSTETNTEETFKQAYIVGSKEYADGWLSFSKDGEPYHPLNSDPVQIASEGDHYQEVYSWNETYQRYEKKIYNESVTLIENIIAPEWIKIVWSSFPNVKCVANAKGYYKTMTDTDWGDIKGVGDVIFEGNILKEGLAGFASNMIIYYSEVIPSTKESTTKEVNDIKDVFLDDPIMWLNTIDSKTMAHDRILLVDLTDKFDEEPTKDQLLAEANKYISEYKLGNVTTNTTVSFVEVEENQNKFENFSHVELGDTIQVVHNDVGVNTELRVISTKFDAITEKYTSVELGTKKDKLSTQSVETGDKITSLTNDADYADITTVNKLIAKTVTADFINAANATLSKAQIDELKVSKIEMPGVIEASQYVVDKLVANLLVAESAEVSKTLTAGNIKINGELNIYGGSINISDSEEDGETYFEVDSKGNVKANSVDITGGSLNIGENFRVSNIGDLSARNANILGTLIIQNGSIFLGDENGDYVNIKPDGSFVSTKSSMSSIYLGNGNQLSTYVNDDIEDPNNDKLMITTKAGMELSNDKGSFKIGTTKPSTKTVNMSLTIDDSKSSLVLDTKKGMYSIPYIISMNNDTENFPDDMFCEINAICTYEGASSQIKFSSLIQIAKGSHTANGTLSNIEFLKDLVGKFTVLRWTIKINDSAELSGILNTGSINYKYRDYSTIDSDTIESDFSLVPGDARASLGKYYEDDYNKYWQKAFIEHGIIGYHYDDWLAKILQYSIITTKIYSEYGMQQGSDIKLKSNIESLTDKYIKMFDELRPVTYTLNKENNGNLHIGFIAQEVADAMHKNGIKRNEFAALQSTMNKDNDETFSLAYTEFIPLAVAKIQQLEKKIKELESKEEINNDKSNNT